MNEITSAIQAAIQGAGGPAKVSRQCGVSVQAVCFWRDGGRTLPAEHCITLEKMNGGRIRCEQMMPSVDWGYLRTSNQSLSELESPATQSTEA